MTAIQFWNSKCPLCWFTFELRELERSLCGVPIVLVTMRGMSEGRGRDRQKVFSLLDASLGMTIESWLIHEDQQIIPSELHNPAGLAVCLTAQIVRHYTQLARDHLVALTFSEDELRTHAPHLHQLMKLWMYCDRDDHTYVSGTPPREQLIALKREAIASLNPV